jgi:putative glutamine amidotransferase
VTAPRIGVSARVTGEPGRQHTGVHIDYVHSVSDAGGVPLVLVPAMGPSGAADALAACHGLLLTGGEDLLPESYGLTGTEHVRDADPERDAFEIALFHAARANRVPVLAICRGFQLVNVVLGGTLWQDLPVQRPSDLDHDKGSEWHERTHHVRLVAGSRALEAMGQDLVLTNSFHHQGIRDLAGELHVTASADDGVIEAAEGDDDGHWLVCVQWHPESFWRESDAPEKGLFRALVNAAGEWRSGRSFQFTEDAVG